MLLPSWGRDAVCSNSARVSTAVAAACTRFFAMREKKGATPRLVVEKVRSESTNMDCWIHSHDALDACAANGQQDCALHQNAKVKAEFSPWPVHDSVNNSLSISPKPHASWLALGCSRNEQPSFTGQYFLRSRDGLRGTSCGMPAPDQESYRSACCLCGWPQVFMDGALHRRTSLTRPRVPISPCNP